MRCYHRIFTDGCLHASPSGLCALPEIRIVIPRLLLSPIVIWPISAIPTQVSSSRPLYHLPVLERHSLCSHNPLSHSYLGDSYFSSDPSCHTGTTGVSPLLVGVCEIPHPFFSSTSPGSPRSYNAGSQHLQISTLHIYFKNIGNAL
ncbi:unnamed protein product [Gordionus sp. m RMFG-2023]